MNFAWYTWYKYTDYVIPMGIAIIALCLAIAAFIHWRFK